MIAALFFHSKMLPGIKTFGNCQHFQHCYIHLFSPQGLKTTIVEPLLSTKSHFLVLPRQCLRVTLKL